MESEFYEFCVENGYSGAIEINPKSAFGGMEFKVRKDNCETSTIVPKADIDYSRCGAFERAYSELYFRMEGHHGAYN